MRSKRKSKETLQHAIWMEKLHLVLELVREDDHFGVRCMDQSMVFSMLDDVIRNGICLDTLALSWRGDAGAHPEFKRIFKGIVELQQKKRVYKKIRVKTQKKEIVDYIAQLCTEGHLTSECHLYTERSIEEGLKSNVIIHKQSETRIHSSALPLTDDDHTKTTVESVKSDTICGAPWNTPCVTVDGDVTFCSCDAAEHAVIGNVNVRSLVELWNSDAIIAIRTKAAQSSSRIADFCMHCSMKVPFDYKDVVRYFGLIGKKYDAYEVASEYVSDESIYSSVIKLTNSKSLTICLLSREYSPETAWGGIGRYTYQLAHGLAERGHSVHVITETFDDDTAFLDGGIYVHQLRNWHIFRDEKSYPEWSRRIEYAYRIADKIKEIQKHYGLNIVESPNFYAEGYVYSLTRNVPLVTRLHSTFENVVLYQGWDMSTDFRLSCLCEDRLVQRSDILTCSTHVHAGNVLKADIGRRPPIHIIPLGVALPTLASEKEEDILRLLFVGRLEHRKGADVLFEALPAILDDRPDIICDIVGRDTFSTDGSIGFEGDPEHSCMEWLKKKLPKKYHSRVIFHGYVADVELAKFYRSCDVFVAPSRYESCGYIYLEAMSHGKAVVGCRIGGVLDIIRNGETGVLVEPGNSQHLAVEVITLLRDESKRNELGRAGRAYVEENHTIEQMVSETEALYRSL